MAHFNAIAGRDGWRDVRQIVVIGRPQPKPSDVERLGEALTGHAVLDRVKPGAWYERADALVAGQLGEADGHPDEMAERVRRAIAEGEVLQAIGRGRGMNRTADNPLDVMIFGALPTGLETEPIFWDDLAPTPADFMMAEAGIALENSADVAKLFPQLWPSADAAKEAMQRARGADGDISVIESLIRECPRLIRVSYQKSGEGQHPACAVVDPQLVPCPRTFLQYRLGPLAWVQVERSRAEGNDDPAEEEFQNRRMSPSQGVESHVSRDWSRWSGAP